MKRIMVAMLRPDMNDLPDPPRPEGIRIRPFRPGDIETWCRIECLAGEFADEMAARARFWKDFSGREPWLETHCLFAVNDVGEAVGTATAQEAQWAGRTIGRLGWVAVVPEFQGRGVGRWIVSQALRRIAAEHDAVCLTTQTTSITAVSLYLSFGFRPCPHTPDDEEAWALLSQALGREIPTPRPE